MKILFHGTTKSNLESLLNNTGKKISPWLISDKDKVYFVDLDVPSSYDEVEINKKSAIKKAFTQAKLQSCFCEDVDLYVLECHIDNDIVEDDQSYEFARDKQVDIKNFKNEFIKKVYHTEINKYFKPRIIMGMYEQCCCNRNDIPADLKEYVKKVTMTNDDRAKHIIISEIVAETIDKFNEVSLEAIS